MSSVQVRFAHPWTDPETGTSYTPDQVASIDSLIAAALQYAGIVRYEDASSTSGSAVGFVDMTLLKAVLANYEPVIPRSNIAANRLLAVSADGKTLTFIDPPTSGGTQVSVPVADADTRGTVKLRGDLGGTADNPTVPGLADRLTLAQVQTAVADMLLAGSGITIATENGRLRLSVTGAPTDTGGGDGTYSATYLATY